MTNRSEDTPEDWRRRRERGPQQPVPETAEDSGEEVVASRTLFSILEPVLNTIGSFGAPLVIAGVVGLAAGITLLTFVGTMKLYGYITIGLGASLIGLVALISLSTVFAAFISRTGRYGVNTIIMLAAFAGIIVVANFISFENNRRMDITATNQFSVASRTKQLLKELDEPVRATAFYITDYQLNPDLTARRAKVKDTLEEFEARSGKFSFRFLDPDLDPDTARNYGVSLYESIAIEGLDSGIISIVEPTDEVYGELEQDLVTSILVASGQERKNIYYLLAHGERSLSSTAPDGYISVRAGLEQDNYQVTPLIWDPLEAEVTIPDDAAMVLIPGPTGDLPDGHAETLNLYLQGRNRDGSARREGGRLIVLIDTDTRASFLEFLAGWGVVVQPGYIRDIAQALPGQPRTLQARPYLPPPPELAQILPPAIPQITAPKGVALGATLMPGAASLEPILEPDDGLYQFFPLVVTSPESYLIEDLNRTEPITDAGDLSDPQGPFIPAVYVQAFRPVGGEPPTDQPPENEIGELVVFGDSDFLGNSFFQRPTSGPDLFLNSANYLLGDFSLVSIRPKAFVFREFNLDRNEYNFVRFSSWFFLPGLLGLMGTLVWWLRR